MNLSLRSSLFISVLFIVCSAESTNVRTTRGIGSKLNSTGICEIEVPVVSILPPELKHTAGSIRGNGTNPSHSKIKLCCAGYKLAAHSPFHCIPDCPNGCGFGNCTAPNICSCNKGAGIGPDGKCISVCPKSCLNGQCYGAFCNCNPGFTVAPNNNYCVPGCTKNCGPGGQCVANNQCKCQTGYQLNSAGTCSMICDKGYKVVGHGCEPICVTGCVNGECVAPNQCRCNSGYTMQANACVPKCANPCYNGVCSAPNVCTCKQGYVKDNNSPRSNRCVAYCAHGCVNAVCSAPNYCICKQGFRKQSPGSNVCVKA